MKRFCLLLALLIGLSACLMPTVSAQQGAAAFYHNGNEVARINRNADGSLTLPAAPDTGDKRFIGWVIKGSDGTETLHAAGDRYEGAAAGDLRFDALAVSLYTLGGAAVTYNSPHILRFDGAIPMADHHRLLSLAGVNNVSFGVLIAPYKSTLGAIFDHNTLPADAIDRESTAFLYTTDTFGVFSGKTNEIPDSALLEKYCARAYLSVKLGDKQVTVYADYDANKHIRSAHGVAAAAFMDRTGEADATHTQLTEAGCYSRYNSEQLAALKKKLDQVVYVSVLDDGSVQSKYSRDNYTFYTFDCLDSNGKSIHTLYTSPYRVDRVLRDHPVGYDTYVITGVDGADFNAITAYFVGGSYRAPNPSEWREDGLYISVELPKS